MAERLKINEIYHSIQGESTWAGKPCTFVRLTGCHLRCSYCDSAHSFYHGNWMTVTDVVARVNAIGGRLVEITGGEPLLQPACGTLAEQLMAAGHTVLCETAGALPIDRLPAGVIRVMDLKCPSSGEVERNDWNNIALLNKHDEVKFVVGDREDYQWAVEVIHRYGLDSICTVLMSPVFGAIEPRSIIEWILADRLNVIFQLQMHKFIWAPDTIGV